MKLQSERTVIEQLKFIFVREYFVFIFFIFIYIIDSLHDIFVVFSLFHSNSTLHTRNVRKSINETLTTIFMSDDKNLGIYTREVRDSNKNARPNYKLH